MDKTSDGAWQTGWSLTRRLAVIAAVAVLAALVLGGGAMYMAATLQDEQMIDSRLEQVGATIQTLLEEVPSERLATGAVGAPRLKTRPMASSLYEYQVWLRDGPVLVLRSHEAPSNRPLADFEHFGYADARIDGEDFRVFSLPTRDRRMVIQVAENTRETWNPALQTSASYLALLLIPFGILLGVVWYLGRRALHSIHTLADTLRSRNPQDATALPVASPPREMVPILDALDRLFTRMRHALTGERHFTSLAAHELRTPLAGLRANAQLLTRAGLQGEALEAANDLIVGVDRATQMLHQLLDLARVESMEAWQPAQADPVHMDVICSRVLDELSPRAMSAGIGLVREIEVLALPCHEFAISVLLRNLVTNAIQHTPVDGQVLVRLARHEGLVQLSVDDTGPGIPPAMRDRAFERFERLDGARPEGVGLGLSIVLSVVKMHDARILLDESPLGGLGVRVRFSHPAVGMVAPA